MPVIINSVDLVTPAWLTQVLREGGYLDQARVIAIEPAGQQSTLVGGPGFRPSNSIRVSYSADAPQSAPLQLYLKTGDGTIHKLAGKREITFYSSIAATMPYPPAAHCYHAAYDAGTGAYHLLLDDVSETHRTVHPEEPATRGDAEQMLDALARLHAHWWGHPRLGKDIGTLPTAESIKQDFLKLSNSFPEYVDFLGDRLCVERRGIYEQVLTRFPDVLAQRLAARGELTVVHKDAHAGNFLLPCESHKQVSYIVDWEQWSVHAGPCDVAYLIALFWYPERRMRMEQPLVREYHSRLLGYGVTGYDWDACWNDYRVHAIENLLVPFWAWIDRGRHWGFHRWHQLEKAMLAYHDLECVEFLEG